MSKSADKLSREERLAQKLRENLRRRKVQTKALSAAEAQAAGGSVDGDEEQTPADEA